VGAGGRGGAGRGGAFRHRLGHPAKPNIRGAAIRKSDDCSVALVQARDVNHPDTTFSPPPQPSPIERRALAERDEGEGV